MERLSVLKWRMDMRAQRLNVPACLLLFEYQCIAIAPLVELWRKYHFQGER